MGRDLLREGNRRQVTESLRGEEHLLDEGGVAVVLDVVAVGMAGLAVLSRLAPQGHGSLSVIPPSPPKSGKSRQTGSSVRAFVKAVRASPKVRFASAGCFSRRCTRAGGASVRAIARVAFVSVIDTHGPVSCGAHSPHGGTFVWSLATASFCPGRMSWCVRAAPIFTSS
ncbi:MAG: hypothetical protein U0599_24890 [Vicinamibacteria bacterium]